MTVILLAVGVGLGPFTDARGVTSYPIDFDGQEVMVSEVEYAVWRSVRDRSGESGDTTWDDVLGLAGQIPDPLRVAGSLTARGLLAEVRPLSEQVLEFAARHAVRPRVVGLGTDEHGWIVIGIEGFPVASVPAELFELVAGVDAERSLLEGCERVAADRRSSGESDPRLSTARGIAETWVAQASELIAVGAIVLDAAQNSVVGEPR